MNGPNHNRYEILWTTQELEMYQFLIESLRNGWESETNVKKTQNFLPNETFTST